MSQPKYKLIYFDFQGKGEPLRWIFKYAKVPFEDVRLKEFPHYLKPDAAPEWDKFKSSVPYQQVPVLEVNGKYLGQTQAIARYLGQQFNLLGKNDWETAEVDALAAFFFQDVEAPMMAFIRAKEPNFKLQLLEEYRRTTPAGLQKIEAILKANKSKSGFLVSDNVTWMDFILANFAEWLVRRDREIYDECPWLEQHHKLVTNLPGVKEWLAERPKQDI